MRPLAASLAVARLRLLVLVRTGLFKPASLLQPLVVIFIVLGGGFASRFEAGRNDDVPAKIAIAEAPAASSTLATLADRLRTAPGIELLPRTDPADEVVHGRADAALVADAAGGIRILQLPSAKASRAGAGRLRAAIADTDLDVARADFQRVSTLDIKVTAIDKTPAGRRLLLLAFLPTLVILTLQSASAAASSGIRGSKADRSIEATLAMPLPRGAIVGGVAVAAVAEGALRLVLALGALAGVAAAHVGAPISLPATTVVAAFVAGVATLVVYVGVGSLAGAVARTAGQEGAVTTLLTFGLAFGPLLAPPGSFVTLPRWLAVLPVIGPSLFIRQQVAGLTGVVGGAISLVGGVTATVLLLVAATRFIGRDGIGQRES